VVSASASNRIASFAESIMDVFEVNFTLQRCKETLVFQVFFFVRICWCACAFVLTFV
jgi:hypothetical protein